MPIISTEELFGQDEALTGNILLDKGNSNIPKNIVTTEELFGDAIPSGVLPKNSAFLPGRSRVENMIANRPNMGAAFREEINQIPEGFIAKVLQPYVAAYKGLGALMQRGEAAVANPLMGLQEGNLGLKDLVNLAAQGIRGERSGELGDIPRSVGVDDTISALIGLGGVSGLGNLLTKGKLVGDINKGIGVARAEGKQLMKNAGQSAEKTMDKVLRGGVPKLEAERIATEYGTSNGSLVEVVKNKIKSVIASADNVYNQVFKKAPNNKFIDIRPAIEESGARLRRLGLITQDGNLTQLGASEIAKDTTYGRLLDFYKSADAISGIENLQGKALTQAQMVKVAKANKQTLVNKDQFLFLRDKLNSLYKNKPSDIDVSRVVDSFYQAGENSGLRGLQAARKLEREAFLKAEKFIDSKGDLKIATEAKLNKIGVGKISKQELEHIRELQKYVDHPILDDATKINRINQAKAGLQRKKDMAIGAGIGTGATLAIGGVGGAMLKKMIRD